VKILFIFMDGVGLGDNDPEINPFIRAHMPNLENLLDGRKISANGGQRPSKMAMFQNERASLLSLDACLGIDGLPQSASGQASLLTGKNVASMLGMHDGPKPSPQVMDILKEGTLFQHFNHNHLCATLLNAYPPRYFKSIERGYKLPGVIALSALYAGMQLKTKDDLQQGEAISVDFTALGWRDHLGLHDTPILEPFQAGERLFSLGHGCQLAFFEYWLSDVAGHQQDMPAACSMLELFDAVLGSLLRCWNDEEGLILITSDHGNLEDLSTRHHTRNNVPLLLVGSQSNREIFTRSLVQASGTRQELNLTDIAPAILNSAELSR